MKLSRKEIEKIFAVEGIEITKDDWSLIDKISDLPDKDQIEEMMKVVRRKSPA